MSGQLLWSCTPADCAPPASTAGLAETLRIYLHRTIGMPRYRTRFLINNNVVDGNQDWSTLTALERQQNPVNINVVVASYTADYASQVSWAIQSEDTTQLSTLLESAADPNQTILTRLQHYPAAYMQPLQYSVWLQATTISSMLLLAKAQVNNVNNDTPLTIACRNSDLRLTRLLLRSSASINLENAAGNAPLHLSIQHSSTPMVKLLLRCAASMELRRSYDGLTALAVAVSHSRATMARLLLQHKAMLHEPRTSRTALHVAAALGKLPLMSMLTKAGADTSATDNQGKVPAQLLPKGITFRQRFACKRLLDCSDDGKPAAKMRRNHHTEDPASRKAG